MPRNSGYGLLGMAEVGIVPERRGWSRSRAQEMTVFFIRDLRCGEEEGIDPHAMDGAFAILARRGAHEEAGCGNSDERGLNGQSCNFGLRWSERHHIARFS